MNVENSTRNSRFKLIREKPDGKERMVVKAEAQPDRKAWADLHDEVRNLLLDGLLSWRFDLTEIARTDSETLGLLVTISATIENRDGHSEFLVASGSHIERTLQLTKLHQILNVISE